MNVSDSIPLQSSDVTPPMAVKQGDEGNRWFSNHVEPHATALKAYVHSAYPTLRDTDDVVQEAYLRIWKARALYPIRSVKAFLFRIAKNVALDTLRHGRASPITAVPDLGELAVMDHSGKDGADAACNREEIELLVEALESLPPRIREIVVLRKFQNVPQREVAARLGISELTVQEQVYRGVRRLEKLLVKRGVIRPWQP